MKLFLTARLDLFLYIFSLNQIRLKTIDYKREKWKNVLRGVGKGVRKGARKSVTYFLNGPYVGKREILFTKSR